jgi:hypothetical protein
MEIMIQAALFNHFRFKKSCSRGLAGNVFGKTPNTAGEDARATQNPDA